MNVRIRFVLLLALLSGQAGCGVNHDAEVARIFADYQGAGTPGAAVLVIQDGEAILTGTYGQARLEDGAPVNSATNFRLASVTKQFTAMSILMLVERGKLDLEDTLYDIFPGFAEFAKDITVTNLLQHTSGLLDYDDFVPSDSPTQVHDSDVLEMMKSTDHTYFVPGSEYRYSNSGYAVLAMMVEKFSGLSFPEFLKENIFDPVGMTNTVAFVDGVNEVPHRAYGYTVGADKIGNTDQSPWSAVLGDGGIYSSLDDLYRWDQALYTDDLVSSEMLEKSWTPRFENYGFGWRIDTYKGRTRYHHSGGTSGFRNYIERFPDEEFTIIVLTNRADPEVGPLAEQIADLYLQ